MKQEYTWEALFGRVVCFSLNKAVTAWVAENNLLTAYNVPRNKTGYYYAQAHNGIVLSHSDMHHLRRSVTRPVFDDYCLAAKRHHTRLTIAKWSNIWYGTTTLEVEATPCLGPRIVIKQGTGRICKLKKEDFIELLGHVGIKAELNWEKMEVDEHIWESMDVDN